jgi:hypothetical protein
MYMSYKRALASHHIKEVKRYIESIPEAYPGLQDMTEAETAMHYRIAGKEFVCTPEGVLGGKRGLHPKGMICDDLLSDSRERKKLDLSTVHKVTDIFLQEISNMPTEELHLTGTPQTEDDLLSRVKSMPEYKCSVKDCYLDLRNKIVLWPEKWPFEALQAKENEIGRKAFAKEYRNSPAASEEAYLSLEDIKQIVNPHLANYWLRDRYEAKETAFAGFDIGKRRHPSHLGVFVPFKYPNGYKGLRQICSRWFDHKDYGDQLRMLKQAIEHFNIGLLLYDNTRGEFEAFDERGELPEEMQPITFGKNQYAMATEMDILVTNKAFELVPDERQKKQMRVVDNDLDAVQTADGHGDCFYSTLLGIAAWKQNTGDMVWSMADEAAEEEQEAAATIEEAETAPIPAEE